MTPTIPRNDVTVTPELVQKLQGTLVQLTAEKEQTDMELVRQRQLVAKQEDQLKALSTDLQVAREASTKLQAVNAQNVQLNRNLADVQDQLRKRDQDLSELDSAIKTVKAEAATEKAALATRLTQLDATLTQKDALIAQHLAEIANLKARPPVAPPTVAASGKVIALGLVASTVAEQVSSAQNTMKNAGSFQLANVSVKLRAVAEDDGSKIRILGANDIRSLDLIGAMDEFNFSLTPKPSEPAPAAGQVAVPDLSGLTQNAVQRALAVLGLRLDIASGKPPATAQVASGQAFRQSPAAGTHADRGIAVLVVFAE